MPSQQTKVSKKHPISLLEQLHPHQLALYLAMFGSGILFLFIMIAHFATRSPQEVFIVSNYFSYSTSILLFSSYPIARLMMAYIREEGRKMISGLSIASFAGSIFVLLQLIGWSDMIGQGQDMTGRSGGFLYVLSGLHLLHIVSVVIVSSFMTYQYAKRLVDPVKTLLLFNNPYEQIKLKMLMQAWVFLHMVWVIIYVYFVLLN
jgi:cytochrome c oxidase subunit 3